MAGNALPSINIQRLRDLLTGINQFGHETDSAGFSRPAFSTEDIKARHWLSEEMRKSGLSVEIDPVGNVIGRWDVASGRPAVMIGSHTDTVVSGGAFDGALGVAVGLECVLALRDAGIEPTRSIAVVSTSDEEGRFGGMLGSQALAGLVDEDWMESAVDADGVRLWDAMEAAGFNPRNVSDAALHAGSVMAFLELHIEQGPVLEHSRKQIGIVDRIAGVCNWTVRLHGVANHAGSTPMLLRADAFAGLAALATTVPELIAESGSEHSRITIGKVELQPNTPHTIPGQAEFSVIFKESNENAMRALTDGFAEQLARAADAHRLRFEIEEHSWLPPVPLDAGLRGLIGDQANAMNLDYAVMPSGGGHDSQTMAALCPTALVFVPSKGGISHSPEEDTDWSDIEVGARLMLRTVNALCSDDADRPTRISVTSGART